MTLSTKVTTTAQLLKSALLCFFLAGCAAGPIKVEPPPSTLSLEQVRTAIAGDGESVEYLGKQVLWGGKVLSVANLAETTQIEIMAYPLDRRQRPMVNKTALGRFVASHDGFVEPLDFPEGRFVTQLGTLSEPVSGTVGQAQYVYPVVKVSQSHLWSPQNMAPRTGFSFGIGISL